MVDNYTQAVYTWPMHLKLEAVDVFKTFKAVVENELGKGICEVMTDNARELSMGEMLCFCKAKGIKISTTVPYHPASNGVAERAIRVLTGAVCAMLHR